MAAEVVLPRQGWTMEVGSIVEWRKRDGDRVEVGDVLFTLQSDKAVNEIEALDAGVLRIPPDSPAPGVEVPIGTVLAYIVAPGEEAPLRASPAVRRRAAELGVDLLALGRARPGARIELADVEAAAGTREERQDSSRPVLEPVTGIRRIVAER